MYSLLPEVPLAHQRACRAQELLQRHLVAVLGGQAATRAPMQTFGKRGRPEGRRPAPDDFLARGQRVGWHRAKSRVAGFRAARLLRLAQGYDGLCSAPGIPLPGPN